MKNSVYFLEINLHIQLQKEVICMCFILKLYKWARSLDPAGYLNTTDYHILHLGSNPSNIEGPGGGGGGCLLIIVYSYTPNVGGPRQTFIIVGF